MLFEAIQVRLGLRTRRINYSFVQVQSHRGILTSAFRSIQPDSPKLRALGIPLKESV